MHDFYLLLFRVTCLILVIGLIKPEYVLRWTPFKTRQRVGIYFIPPAIVFLLASFFTGGHTATEAAPTMTNLSIVSLESLMPSDEKNFIDVIEKYASLYKKATDADSKTKIWHERETKLNIAKLNGIKMLDWVGTIQSVGATSDGKAFIAIHLTPTIMIRTNNNAYADSADNTLILQKSTMYSMISTMAPGNRVRFSGILQRDISPTENSGMTTPEYLALFNDIKPI